MVIKHLTVRVPHALRSRFPEKDARIWTATLAAQPGHPGKETWADAADPDTLHLIFRWQCRAHWKAVPSAVLAKAHARMIAATGQDFSVLI